MSDKLPKQGAMKNMSETSYSNLLLSSHEIISILEKNVYKQIGKGKFAIPSCSRYLARVIYKLRQIHGTQNIHRMRHAFVKIS